MLNYEFITVHIKSKEKTLNKHSKWNENCEYHLWIDANSISMCLFIKLTRVSGFMSAYFLLSFWTELIEWISKLIVSNIIHSKYNNIPIYWYKFVVIRFGVNENIKESRFCSIFKFAPLY